MKFVPVRRVLARKLVPAFIFATVVAVGVDAHAADVGTGINRIMRTQVPDAVSSGQAARLGDTQTAQVKKLALNLPLRNEAELDSLIQQIYDPHSPNYHHYLSAQEFADRFAPTQADYDAVVGWAQVNGFTVTRIVPNRRLVDVQAPVETIDRALHIKLTDYRHPTEDRSFFAPDREPTVDLGVPLLKITGLTDVNLPHNHMRRGTVMQQIKALAHAEGSGPSGNYVPSDIRAAYYGSGSLTGAGQTVAIFSFEGYKASDLALFYSKTGTTSSVPVHNVLVNGFSGTCNSRCDDGEQVLDIGNVVGMAPGLSQVLFYEGDSATDVLNQMATDNTAKVISSSWGGGDFGSADDPIYKQFAAQGQTFLNASGDDGSYNSRTWDPPSLDPNILDVGGTSLVTNGAGGAWVSETGWGDTFEGIYGASGGGFYSKAGYSIPSYQSAAGVITSTNKGSTTLRNDPDLSMEGDFDNITVSQGSVETGVAGTSYAAPRWAGLLALANQQSVAAGHGTVGFVNPKLYQLGLSASYHSLFHDITSGSNKPSSGSGTTFNAVAGFDLVTGWGSPIGAAFI
ncbi:MAG TPA: S53 family serine peptidase, partial [Dyella sp.]|uniref:S53 family peptidase n=1 Tax=Dyella sp. TaxID=1869338 RepID=UPI002F92F070